MAMLCATKPYIIEAFTAEACALWKDLELATKLGFSHIVLEGDALAVTEELKREGACWGIHGPILNDAKFLLKQCQAGTVRHVRRQANEAAHQLAKLALSFNEERVWRADFPTCMQAVVIAEQTRL
jgi:ribonuclease HI